MVETQQERDERLRSSEPVAEPLPDGTKMVFNHASHFSAPVRHIPDEYLEVRDIDPDEYEPSDRIYFDPGDELPLELARRVWDDFGDVLEATDGNEKTINQYDDNRNQDEISQDKRWS
jgi:hypothetical protein